MKNKLYFLGIVALILFGCASQEKVIKNINCSGEVVLQYDKIKKSDKGKPIANKDLKAFTVYFINDFNDSIQGYVNDRLCYDKYLKINSNSDNLKDSFGYNYSKDEKTPVLKVISKTKKICFDIEINKKYKLIYVFITNENKWTVRFSNIYYIQ
jgi:hypothetical protein